MAPEAPSPPAWACPCPVKLKGFKCKYFSFIDASCPWSRLYRPISSPYLGLESLRGAVGGGGERGRLPEQRAYPPSSECARGVCAGSSPLPPQGPGTLHCDLGCPHPLTLVPGAALLMPCAPPTARGRAGGAFTGRGAHKAKQLELKIYAKQLLTDSGRSCAPGCGR